MFARAADKSENYLIRADVMRTGVRAPVSQRSTRFRKFQAHERFAPPKIAAWPTKWRRCQELVDFDLETLIGMIRLAPLPPRERVAVNAYLSKEIVNARSRLDTVSDRARTLQTVLREYMVQREDRFDIRPPVQAPGKEAPAAPGPSESFVKDMMTLAAAAQDREFEYRRALTEALIAASAEAAEVRRQVGYYQDLLSHSTASGRTTHCSQTFRRGRPPFTIDSCRRRIAWRHSPRRYRPSCSIRPASCIRSRRQFSCRRRLPCRCRCC